MSDSVGKILTELSAGDVTEELERAGVAGAAGLGEREAFLRLSTQLIDSGEDPATFSFRVNQQDKENRATRKEDSLHGVKKEETKEKMKSSRKKLLEKIIRLEKNYFAKTNGARGL